MNFMHIFCILLSLICAGFSQHHSPFQTVNQKLFYEARGHEAVYTSLRFYGPVFAASLTCCGKLQCSHVLFCSFIHKLSAYKVLLLFSCAFTHQSFA